MNLLKRLFTTFVLTLPFLPASSLSAPIVWRAETDSVSYLMMGSIHVGQQSMYPLPSVITNAINQKHGLIVEADILTSIIEIPPYHGPKTSAVLNSHQLEAIALIAKELQIPLSFLLQGPPWQTAMQLQLSQALSVGLQPKWGVDLTLLKQAQHDQAPVYELEGVNEQFAMLDELPEHGAPLLRNTIDHWHEMEPYLPCMVEAWSAGDEASFDKLLALSAIDPQTDDALIFERNRTWVQKLQKDFSHGDFVIVVGMLHMIGEQGLPSLLQQQGFEVEIITENRTVDCMNGR